MGAVQIFPTCPNMLVIDIHCKFTPSHGGAGDLPQVVLRFTDTLTQLLDLGQRGILPFSQQSAYGQKNGGSREENSEKLRQADISRQDIYERENYYAHGPHARCILKCPGPYHLLRPSGLLPLWFESAYGWQTLIHFAGILIGYWPYGRSNCLKKAKLVFYKYH
jgi:hypothetical protein